MAAGSGSGNETTYTGVVWPANDGLAALEINCATIDESDTSAESLGTH